MVEQFWHREPGGTATATEQTLSALTDRNEFHIAGLAARHSPPVPGRPDPWRRMPARSTLRFHWLPRPALYEAWLRLGWPSVDRYCDPNTVVWASSLVVPPSSAPTVATVHDLDFLDNPVFSTRRGRSFFPLVWRRAQERADLMICPTQLVADDCVRRGVDQERLRVVPWGVGGPRSTEADAAAIVAEFGLKRPFVLWVGPLSPRKNPRGAALAMGRVDADLVVVGGRGEDPEAAAALGSLGARVHRLRGIDDDRLSALYRAADALLYPSIAEGFGLPILEAMVHGTPVVTSLGTATAEVAGSAALLVDPHRPDEIADAVNAALFDGPTRARLIDDGHGRAASMTWESTAKGYAEAFRSVL